MNARITGLFGGALFAAGIAHAQEFNFEPNTVGGNFSTIAYAYGADITGIGSFDDDTDLNVTPGPASADANYNGFGGDADVNTSLIRASAFTRSYLGAGLGVANAFAVFSIDQPADIEISWDFSEEQPYVNFEFSGILLRNWTAGTNEFQITEGDASSGTVVIPLTPGNLYTIALDAIAFEPGDTFAQAVLIAAPDCPADCDANGTLNLDDLDCFVAGFLGGDLDAADINGDGVLNLDDLDAFVSSFLAGCP